MGMRTFAPSISPVDRIVAAAVKPCWLLSVTRQLGPWLGSLDAPIVVSSVGLIGVKLIECSHLA